jgi:hypothetical protein
VAEPTALLIAAEAALAEQVRRLVSSTPHLTFQCLPTCQEACARLRLPGVALVLAHLPKGGDPAEVGRLLRGVAASPWPAAAVVLADEHRPEQALAFLRQGAADVLDRPLDLHRLGYLIDPRTIDPRITVEVRAAPDLWPALADPGQISQVVMNLCLNARDAMPEGGRLALEAENAVVGQAGPGPASACRSGLTKAEAERLLDWLEANGYQGRELRHEEGGTFEVRWRDEEGLPRGAVARCRRLHRLPCPYCGSTRRPYLAREMTALSRALVALGVLVWPLLPVGLLLRRDVWRCWDCRRVLGRGRRATLGR